MNIIKKRYSSQVKKHSCTLAFGSDSMLPKPEARKKLCHIIRKSTLIAVLHPDSWNDFVSYPAIMAERQRQVVEGGAWVIHPYSVLSLIWNILMVIVNITHIIVAPLRFTHVLPKWPPTHSVMDHILFPVQIACILDIIAVFNTGYKDSKEVNIVMSRRRIALHYLLRWFLVDLISSLPFGYMMPFLSLGYRYQMFAHLVPCVRCVKICFTLKKFKVISKIFKTSYIWRRGLRHTLVFVFSIHLCSCLLYVAAITNFYWNGSMPKGYTKFLITVDGDMTKVDASHRYQKAIFISCAAFFGTGYTMLGTPNPEETIIYAIIILYGSIFMVYTIVFLLKIYLTKCDCNIRYEELMNQIEKYMRLKQFPMRMKKRVRDFYNYTYQKRYFKEYALDCLSDQLRNEIALDTCHKLIQKVPLFEGLPPTVVGTILGCLKPEVYMPNDLIIRAGDIGECMYFIANGTVAVYSMKGAEMCHLEDGAHFGEVALLMMDRKRVASVVAVEITQVYRLDAGDFRDSILTYQELYVRIEALASKRMHEIVVIDDTGYSRNSKQ